MDPQGTVVEIVAIGNELLIGDVLDTNTHWLCRRITGLGGVVQRAVMVRDDVEAIGREVLGAIRRGARVVFTTGGLGPTADDMTLQALAQALQRPLALHPVALDLVRARYRELAEAGYVGHAEMTPERLKMATLPQGATPLPNPVGGAPGVLLEHEGAAIVALPGVPEELKGIVEQSLPPMLKEWFGQAYYQERVMVVACGDESVLAPVVDAVARAHPEVYVKSRAKAYGPEVRLRVTLSARGQTEEQVARALAAALDDLQARLAAAGIAVLDLS